MARTITGTNTLDQRLVSVAAGPSHGVRPASPLMGHVQEGTQGAQAATSDRLLREAEEQLIDAAAETAMDLQTELEGHLLGTVSPLISAGDEQIAILFKLLADAGVGRINDGSEALDLEKLKVELSGPTPDSSIYRMQIAELCVPMLRSILDTVAGQPKPVSWSSPTHMFRAVEALVDISSWLTPISGLRSGDDATRVLNDSCDLIWRQWREQRSILGYHCDRFFSIRTGPGEGAGVGSVEVRPMLPTMVGQYVQRNGSRIEAASSRTTEIRLIPVRPTVFYIVYDGDFRSSPTLVALDLKTGLEIIRTRLGDNRAIRVSSGSVAVVSTDGSVPGVDATSAADEILDSGGALLLEIDATKDASLNSRFGVGDWVTAIEQSRDLQRVGVFNQINPVNAE